MDNSEIEKIRITKMLFQGLIFNIKLPYSKTTKPSPNTKRAAAVTGGSKGLFVAQNEISTPVELTTEIKLLKEGLIIKNAKGEGQHILIEYTDIYEVKLKKHKVIVKLINNMEVEFETGLIIRIGLKKNNINPKLVLQVLYDYLVKDWKNY